MSKKSESIASYIQSAAIVIAGIWAFYTFVIQDALSPRHVSIDVSILESGSLFIEDVPFKFINYQFVAENTSNRRIKLIVAGTQVHGHQANYRSNMSVPAKSINYPIKSNSTFLWHKDMEWSNVRELVSMAYHFPEYFLNAGEKVSEIKTVVFPESKKYDFVSFSSTAKSLLNCDSIIPWSSKCDRLIAVISSGASGLCEQEQESDYDLCFRYQQLENEKFENIPVDTIKDKYSFSSFTNGIIVPISF